jgi:hypothetical protein
MDVETERSRVEVGSGGWLDDTEAGHSQFGYGAEGRERDESGPRAEDEVER